MALGLLRRPSNQLIEALLLATYTLASGGGGDTYKHGYLPFVLAAADILQSYIKQKSNYTYGQRYQHKIRYRLDRGAFQFSTSRSAQS